MDIKKAILAEFIGTFFIILLGCGSYTIASNFSNGIGILGIALSFGLAIIAVSYALYKFSGANFNPVATVGLWVSGKFSFLNMIEYVVAQTAGAIFAVTIIYLIATGKQGFIIAENSLGVNGFADFSPAHYSLQAVFISELVFSFLFSFIFILANNLKNSQYILPLVSGITFTAIYLVSIPINNGAINPSKSTAAAFLVGFQSIYQLWVFWVAPIMGALLGGLVSKFFTNNTSCE